MPSTKQSLGSQSFRRAGRMSMGTSPRKSCNQTANVTEKRTAPAAKTEILQSKMDAV